MASTARHRNNKLSIYSRIPTEQSHNKLIVAQLRPCNVIELYIRQP